MPWTSDFHGQNPPSHPVLRVPSNAAGREERLRLVGTHGLHQRLGGPRVVRGAQGRSAPCGGRVVDGDGERTGDLCHIIIRCCIYTYIVCLYKLMYMYILYIYIYIICTYIYIYYVY